MLWIIVVILAIVIILLLLPLSAKVSFIDGKFSYDAKFWLLLLLNSDGGGIVKKLRKKRGSREDTPEDYEYNFSDDLFLEVCDGNTVTYICLELAVYMGFKEIYLLGVDCDYSGKKQHVIDTGDVVLNNPESRMIEAYKKAKEYADSHGIKIYNATRGGKLEVFERVDFDSLFPEDDKK